MARKPIIRWRKGDAEKLDKEIKRFNAKVNRTKKKHPDLAEFLPETIKKEEKARLLKEIKSAPRSEFKKQLNSLSRFSEKGAEKTVTSKTGNVVTKWEKKEVSLKVAQINRERTKERTVAENLDVTTQGKSIGFKRGQMGSERMNELKPKPFNFDKIKGGKEWEKYKETVNKQTSYDAKTRRLEDYKSNYIKGLKGAFGDYASDIIEIVESLPADVVVKTHYAEQEATITFFYEKQDMDLKLDVLSNIWQGAMEEHDDKTRR